MIFPPMVVVAIWMVQCSMHKRLALAICNRHVTEKEKASREPLRARNSNWILLFEMIAKVQNKLCFSQDKFWGSEMPLNKVFLRPQIIGLD